MIALDEDALICDFAESYHIYNMYQLPVEYVATLAIGLRDNARIKLKAVGLETDLESLLLAHIADNTAITGWLLSENGRKGKDRPASFVNLLTSKIDVSKQPRQFTSGNAFDKEWERLKNA